MRFKAKKIKKKKYIKYVFIFFLFFSYVFIIFYFNDAKLKNSILSNKLNYFKINLVYFVDKKIDLIVNKPTYFLNANIKNITTKEEITKKTNVNKINNINKEEKKEFKPIIYLYNTHNLEEYSNYTVYDATLLLSNLLTNENIDNIFEEKSVSAFLQTNNLKYYESYNVSRNYINEAKEKYGSLIYFFDIHRDTLSKEKSTISYNGKSYAKILFLIGLENKFYENNLINANELNDIIESIIPGISRGIMKKEGKNVNGIYNQDISENIFLIELGSLYSTKEEVENTVNIIKDAIIKYAKGVV